MDYNVKEIAAFFDITHRTIYYYEEIGLLKPKKLNEKGNKEYSDNEIIKLQLILLLKDLGCSLEEIKKFIEISVEDTIQILKLYKEFNEDKIIIMNQVIESEKKEHNYGFYYTQLKELRETNKKRIMSLINNIQR